MPGPRPACHEHASLTLRGMTGTLLSFGHGYSARALSRHLLPRGWTIRGTTRSAEKAAVLRAEGVTPLIFPGDDIRAALEEATHLLVSAGPDAAGDPVLRECRAGIARIAPRCPAASSASTASAIAWPVPSTTTGSCAPTQPKASSSQGSRIRRAPAWAIRRSAIGSRVRNGPVASTA